VSGLDGGGVVGGVDVGHDYVADVVPQHA
jgi:hypothetical protein